MGFFKKRKARKLAKQEAKEALARKKAEAKKVKPVVEKKVEPVKPTPIVEKKVEQPKPQPVKKEAVEVKEVKKTETAAPKEVKPVKYHVSQNKDPRNANYRDWRVRRQGSQKTIKYFSTQKEAIEYAESLADSAGSSIVIHKMDGSIRKQDYKKKS
jgi:outer membrane biosynthesis protein TonB